MTGGGVPASTPAMHRQVEEHRAAARRLAMAVLGDADTAEDVAQDVMVRLLGAKAGFAADADVKGWVYRVTMNRCRDHLRTRRRRAGAVPTSEATPDPALTVEPVAERQLDLEAARRAVGVAMERLPRDQREVLHMRYMEGLGFADIARLTATPQGTVASRVFRALKQLGTVLDRRHLEVLE